MASVLAQAAHSVATSLLANAQIQPGAHIPSTLAKLKEEDAAAAANITLEGKNIIVGVPGAFTGTCHKQIPGYIENFAAFEAKGIRNIFVVAVNDVFVMKAWKANLAPQGTKVRFLSDDNAAFVSSLGLVFDATARLGGPRSKRFVLITDGDQVTSVAVEQEAPQITVTDAKVILAQLA